MKAWKVGAKLIRPHKSLGNIEPWSAVWSDFYFKFHLIDLLQYFCCLKHSKGKTLPRSRYCKARRKTFRAKATQIVPRFIYVSFGNCPMTPKSCRRWYLRRLGRIQRSPECGGSGGFLRFTRAITIRGIRSMAAKQQMTLDRTNIKHHSLFLTLRSRSLSVMLCDE